MARPALSPELENLLQEGNRAVWRHAKAVRAEVGFYGWLRVAFDPPRKLWPTKAGWVFFGFMSGIVVFAISTDNNLLFLLFSAMLAMMIVSGVLSELSLRDVAVRRIWPDRIFAGEPFLLDIVFQNRSRKYSAYAFETRDDFLFKDLARPFAVRIDPGASVTVRVRGRIDRRGRHYPPLFSLETEYPFLLFRKVRDLYVHQEVTVFPQPADVFIPDIRSDSHGGGSSELHAGEGETVAWVRDFRDGDPAGRIDWKKTAKTEKMMTKELELNRRRNVLVVFDPGRAADFEEGLCVVAGLLLRLEEAEVPFSLAAGGAQQTPFTSGRSHLNRCLTIAACYGAPTPPEARPRGAAVILVGADGAMRTEAHA